MKIEIVPVVETKLTYVEEKAKVEIAEPAIVVPELTISLEDIFAKFLQLEVGDGAASEDTIRNYLS
jgi:integrase/recombinase XerD